MADAGKVIGQFSDEVEQATSEVAKDVKDTVGEMLEQGVQTTFGPKLTPQQIQQKQLQDQKDLAETRRKLRYYQNTAAAQKKVRDEGKQTQLQKQQVEEQEKQQKKAEEEENKKRIISPAKKTPAVPGQPAPVVEEIARTRQEIGKGHGVGG